MNTPHGTDTVRYLPVVGFPGYLVGSDGSVWSCREYNPGHPARWRLLRPRPNREGYPRVSLCRDRKVYDRRVSRLVLEAFTGPCPPGQECRHVLDPDPMNCCLENLCWGTPLENARDRMRHGRQVHGQGHGMSRLSEEDIQNIRAKLLAGQSQRSIARQHGISQPHVSDIKRGKRWNRQ